jgi:hypothetical protein
LVLVVGKLLAGRTNINVLLRHIAEVLFAKATSRLNDIAQMTPEEEVLLLHAME